MKIATSIKNYLKVFALLLMLFLFLGCRKENPCMGIVQGDWILVP